MDAGWQWYQLSVRTIGEIAGFDSVDTTTTWTNASKIVILVATLPIGFGLGFTLNIPHEPVVWGKLPFLYSWHNLVLSRAIMNNDFELLMTWSASRYRPVMFTLEDGKVYVGWVVRAPNPVEARKAVRILPLLSGYRDHQTHVVEFTTSYAAPIDAVTGGGDSALEGLTYEDFEIVLPVERLISSHPFDLGVYMYFRSQSEEELEEESAASMDTRDE